MATCFVHIVTIIMTTIMISEANILPSGREKSSCFLLGDTPRNCLSQTTILRHILRHTLRLSHVPLHHPTLPTLSIHLTFPHTIGNSVPVEQSYLRHSLWLSVTLCDYLRDYLRHRLMHVLYYSIVLLLSLFFYLYNLTLILAEVLSYSFRTSC